MIYFDFYYCIDMLINEPMWALYYKEKFKKYALKTQNRLIIRKRKFFKTFVGDIPITTYYLRVVIELNNWPCVYTAERNGSAANKVSLHLTVVW
jgi:hypothetical protein